MAEEGAHASATTCGGGSSPRDKHRYATNCARSTSAEAGAAGRGPEGEGDGEEEEAVGKIPGGTVCSAVTVSTDDALTDAAVIRAQLAAASSRDARLCSAGVCDDVPIVLASAPCTACVDDRSGERTQKKRGKEKGIKKRKSGNRAADESGHLWMDTEQCTGYADGETGSIRVCIVLLGRPLAR